MLMPLDMIRRFRLITAYADAAAAFMISFEGRYAAADADFLYAFFDFCQPPLIYATLMISFFAAVFH